jgi:hypothetical protein
MRLSIASRLMGCAIAALPRRADGCVIWVDRHVHKNAGTSIRAAMNTEWKGTGRMQKLGPYHEVSMSKGWNQLFSAMQTMEQPCDSSAMQTRMSTNLQTSG